MRVAIVGGGYSGTMAAVEIGRALPGAEIVLVEKRPRFAAGAAYSTRSPSHLLNVRARSMSAFADAPDHFVRWVEAQGLGRWDTFARRRDYHRYLAGILDAAAVRRVAGEAVAAEDGTLRLASGEEIGFDALVLAGGNHPGRMPARLSLPSVDDPWSADGAEALAALAGEKGDLLLVGTGLTMVDVALDLEDRGYGGRMLAVSRRGLVPRPHEEPPSPPLTGEPPARLAALVRHVRAGSPWRAAVDSLRPHSIALWRGFSEAEKRRFLRHLRPWWDVHRHRLAPPVARRIAALRQRGVLEVAAGRIAGEAAGEVEIGLRGGGTLRRRFAAAINCTGPEGAIARVEDPLVRQLVAAGAARPDPLGLGLDVDEESRVIGSDGATHPRLFALGPLTKGAFWEMVAVPDIRGQVRGVARTLAR
ncbi:MAG: FAD/NAD(P)-binding protein [Alphaproteobacteria bacterium]|nr:FAD/NAD(P)-binding protein [Alphaproteobacteria bacterium]MBV9372635.1 FAD/NAD(P)-binding protein [Alphaproteobacteria bacterium]MBV9900142.1 FAD/NAD(P)-binding protein [Alphaproteobacteria bacterium]